MRFNSIIFDLDGTLIDSLEDLADAMNTVLRANGFPEHPTDAYRYFVGDGMEMLVRRALPEHLSDSKSAVPYVEAMKSAYPGGRSPKTRPYEGIPELLDACGHAGLTTAVLTNKPDDPTQELISLLFPGAPFALAWGSRPDLPKKPDPAGALRLAERIGCFPEQCVFIGDSAVDIKTANAAGMYAVGALWGFRTADELIGAGARMLLSRPADLIPWLTAESG